MLFSCLLQIISVLWTTLLHCLLTYPHHNGSNLPSANWLLLFSCELSWAAPLDLTADITYFPIFLTLALTRSPANQLLLSTNLPPYNQCSLHYCRYYLLTFLPPPHPSINPISVLSSLFYISFVYKCSCCRRYGVLLRPSIDWGTNDLSSRYVSFVNVRMDLMKQMFDSPNLTIPDYKLFEKLTKRNANIDTEDV